MVCIDMAKGVLTSREALRNYGEISTKMSEKHAKQVLRKIQRQMSRELLENELKEAEIAFKHAGGRGVELAEKIDELKAKLGYDLDNSHI